MNQDVLVDNQIAKARLLGIKCVLDGQFLLKNLINYRYPACLLFSTKKIYTFPEKSELPKFILRVKISWLNLIFNFPGVRSGNEKNAEIRAGSLSRLVASLDFVLTATARSLVPLSAPALKWAPRGKTSGNWGFILGAKMRVVTNTVRFLLTQCTFDSNCSPEKLKFIRPFD